MSRSPRVDRWIDSIVTRKRREIFDRVFDRGPVALDGIATVLDVGSTKDTMQQSSNYFARRLAGSASVTLFSDQPIDAERDIDFDVAGVHVGDASRIAPDIGTYDLVLSSATIEHVGTAEDQRRMISGCLRTARKYVVITTPNRWHPIEFHTKLPLLHWLPMRLHRRLLRAIGFGFFAEEGNLNLLDRKTLSALIDRCDGRERIRACRLEKMRLLGFVSNLVFVIELEP